MKNYHETLGVKCDSSSPYCPSRPFFLSISFSHAFSYSFQWYYLPGAVACLTQSHRNCGVCYLAEAEWKLLLVVEERAPWQSKFSRTLCSSESSLQGKPSARARSTGLWIRVSGRKKVRRELQLSENTLNFLEMENRNDKYFTFWTSQHWFC